MKNMNAAMIQTVLKMMRIMMKEMKMVLVVEMEVYMKLCIRKRVVGTMLQIYTMNWTLTQGKYSEFVN